MWKIQNRRSVWIGGRILCLKDSNCVSWHNLFSDSPNNGTENATSGPFLGVDRLVKKRMNTSCVPARLVLLGDFELNFVSDQNCPTRLYVRQVAKETRCNVLTETSESKMWIKLKLSVYGSNGFPSYNQDMPVCIRLCKARKLETRTSLSAVVVTTDSICVDYAYGTWILGETSTMTCADSSYQTNHHRKLLFCTYIIIFLSKNKRHAKEA
jgi:hypothetical protein